MTGIDCPSHRTDKNYCDVISMQENIVIDSQTAKNDLSELRLQNEPLTIDQNPHYNFQTQDF